MACRSRLRQAAPLLVGAIADDAIGLALVA